MNHFTPGQRSEIARLIKKAKAEERERINKAMDKKWLSPPWSAEWNDEFMKITGYRRAIKDLKELKTL